MPVDTTDHDCTLLLALVAALAPAPRRTGRGQEEAVLLGRKRPQGLRRRPAGRSRRAARAPSSTPRAADAPARSQRALTAGGARRAAAAAAAAEGARRRERRSALRRETGDGRVLRHRSTTCAAPSGTHRPARRHVKASRAQRRRPAPEPGQPAAPGRRDRAGRQAGRRPIARQQHRRRSTRELQPRSSRLLAQQRVQTRARSTPNSRGAARAIAS